MFCPKCGNQIADGAKFCPKCGKPVGQASHAAQAPAVSRSAQTPTPVSAPSPMPVQPVDDQETSPSNGKDSWVRTVAVTCGITVVAVAIAFFLDLFYHATPSQLDQIPTGFYSIASHDFGQVTGYDFEAEEDGTLTFSDYFTEENGWTTTTFHDYLSATAQPFVTLDGSTVFELSDLEDVYGYSPIDPDGDMYLIVPNGCGLGNLTGLWGIVYVPEGSMSQATVIWAMVDVDSTHVVEDVVGTAYVYSGIMDANLLSFEENTWNDYIDAAMADGTATAYQVYDPSVMSDGFYRLLDANDEPVATIEIAGGFVCDPPSE